MHFYKTNISEYIKKEELCKSDVQYKEYILKNVKLLLDISQNDFWLLCIFCWKRCFEIVFISCFFFFCFLFLLFLVWLFGSPHMAAKKQDDQLERTFSSYVRIQVVVLKTYLGRWTIGRSDERGSWISVSQHDMMMMNYTYTPVIFGCVCGVMVTLVEHGHGDRGSNLGWGSQYFS